MEGGYFPFTSSDRTASLMGQLSFEGGKRSRGVKVPEGGGDGETKSTHARAQRKSQGKMRVSDAFEKSLGVEFQACLSQLAFEQGWIPEPEALSSVRFLARSVVPHVLKLSDLFNRLQPVGGGQALSQEAKREAKREASQGLAPYWKKSAHPEHLRLAYLLYYMPTHVYRMAAIWSELARLGFRVQHSGVGAFRAIEFGAGPGSGACGVALGEKFAPVGLPLEKNWALIEQDRKMLERGVLWSQHYFKSLGQPWGVRPFHRTLDPRVGFLPKNAPQFHLWVMSYYLNELELPAEELALALVQAWEHHLAQEGVVILMEPALKLQSRKLLLLRQALLALRAKEADPEWQILLPCLGHQACGALAQPEDWCHEEVSWWRPPYFKLIDQLAGLDRKSLPFSYLVVVKSRRPRNEILPQLQGQSLHRLVSPAHTEGRDFEFFLCGQDGKKRARWRATAAQESGEQPSPERGDILTDVSFKGDAQSTRILRGKMLATPLD